MADELFELDRLVLRDKQLRHLGRYVKDVFGIKIVVAANDDAEALQQLLQGLAFDDAQLAARRLPADDEHRALRFIEVKDYLARESRKHSGWSAIKSVVAWSGRTFELQVQPLSNFLHERERLTRECTCFLQAHPRARARRDRRRGCRCSPSTVRCCAGCSSTRRSEPPVHEGVEVVLTD